MLSEERLQELIEGNEPWIEDCEESGDLDGMRWHRDLGEALAELREARSQIALAVKMSNAHHTECERLRELLQDLADAADMAIQEAYSADENTMNPEEYIVNARYLDAIALVLRRMESPEPPQDAQP